MARNDDILTIPDVATLMMVAQKTVRGLVPKGDLPAFKVGGRWRFRRGFIDSWLEEKTRAAGTQTSRNDAELSNASGEYRWP